MCGIVGALAQRDVSSILIEGLRRLEYRGYDSAGIAVINDNGLERFRALGKVQQMADKIPAQQQGRVGIAHTRWATHGEPSEANAHPHLSKNKIAVVHNGIIENYKELIEGLKSQGYEFSSETDTEVIAHLVESFYTGNLYEAVSEATTKLRGAYALAIIALDSPNELIACRKGSPLVLGIGFEENFVASDVSALLPVTSRFLYLEEGDFAVLKGKGYQIYNSDGDEKELEINVSELTSDSVNKGNFRHFMLKEIYEQGKAIADCLEGRITKTDVLDAIFGQGSDDIFEEV